MLKNARRRKRIKKMSSSEESPSFDGSSSSSGSHSTSGESDYSSSSASGDEKQDKGRFSRTASEKSPTAKRSRRASSSSSEPTPPRVAPPATSVPGKEDCREFMNLGVCSVDGCKLNHPFHEGLHEKLLHTFQLTLDEGILIVAVCYFRNMMTYFPDTQPEPFLTKLVQHAFISQQQERVTEMCRLMVGQRALRPELPQLFLAKSAETSLYTPADLWSVYSYCRKYSISLDENAAEFLHRIFYKEDLLKLFKIMLHFMKRSQPSKSMGLKYLPIVLETIYATGTGDTETGSVEVKEAFADLLLKMPDDTCRAIEPSFIFQYRRSISSADSGMIWAAYHRLLESYTSSLNHNLFHHISKLLDLEDWKDLVYIFLLYGVSYKKGKCINFLFEQFYQHPQKFIDFFIQINKLEKLGRIHLQLLAQMGACLILGSDDIATGYRILSTLQDYRVDPCTLQGPASSSSAIVSSLQFGTTALSICLTLGEVSRALRIYKGMENVFGSQETTHEIYLKQLQLLQTLAYKLLEKDNLEECASVMKTFYKTLRMGYSNFKEAIEESELKDSVSQLLDRVLSKLVRHSEHMLGAAELAEQASYPSLPEWARLSRPAARAVVVGLVSHDLRDLAQAFFSKHISPAPPSKGAEEEDSMELMIPTHWTPQEIQLALRVFLAPDCVSPGMKDITIRRLSPDEGEALSSQQSLLFPQLSTPGSLDPIIPSRPDTPDSVVIPAKSLLLQLQLLSKENLRVEPPPAKKPRLSPEQNGATSKSDTQGSPTASSPEVESDFQKMVQFLKCQLLQRQVPEEKSRTMAVELAKRFVAVSGSGTLSKARMKDLLLFAQCNIPSPPSS